MGLFDSLESLAGQALQSDAPPALWSALDNSSVGGLSGLLGKLQQGGVGDVATSLEPEVLQAALGDAHVQSIANSMGVSPDQVLSLLSAHLPALAAAQPAAAAPADDSNS